MDTPTPKRPVESPEAAPTQLPDSTPTATTEPPAPPIPTEPTLPTNPPAPASTTAATTPPIPTEPTDPSTPASPTTTALTPATAPPIPTKPTGPSPVSPTTTAPTPATAPPTPTEPTPPTSAAPAATSPTDGPQPAQPPLNPPPTWAATTPGTPSTSLIPDFILDPNEIATLPDPVTYSAPIYPHATYTHQQTTPKPPGPPKSTTAAVLLNLTGLGLGYAYLRRRVPLAIALAGTAALITAAFLTNAAADPWLWRAFAASWLVVLAIHAAALGRRHLPATTKRPVLAGAAAVVLVAATYAGYALAGNAIYHAGVEAQKTGNCAVATDKFATVTGAYELTLSENIAQADTRTEECTAYTAALNAQKSGNHDNAIKQYTDFERKYPHSALHTFVYNNLAETYVNRATDWQLPVTEAIARKSGDTLMTVLQFYPKAPAADRVPKAMADLFDAAGTAFRAGDFCDSVAVMLYFTRLDQAAMKDIAATAKANHAKSLYECSLAQVRDGSPNAVLNLETFLDTYPQDPGVPQAKAALVTAKVEQAAGVTLPVPPPLGDNSPGDIPVTFYNDSNTPLTILVAGPTAHEITLPPCAACPADYPPGAEPCPTFDGRPSARLELTPTTYYITTLREGVVKAYTDSITPLVGYEHTQCIYVERG